MELKPVTLSAKPIFDRYNARYPQYHSEASFVTIYSWNQFAPCSYTEINDHLIFTCTMEDETYIRTPQGDFDSALFEETFAYAKENGTALMFLDPTYLGYMKRAHSDIPVNESQGYAEYYYKSSELANLTGRKYLGIRKQLHRFSAEHTYSVEPVSAQNMDEILSMLDEWGAQNITSGDEIKRAELEASRITLAHMNDLNCEGIALRVGPEDRIGALAVWETLQNSVAMIHYEKGLAQFPGIYKVINHETALALNGKTAWINRESDMEIPGLREAKLRYHPDHMCRVWYANP